MDGENERRKRGKEGILVRIDVEGSFAEKINININVILFCNFFILVFCLLIFVKSCNNPFTFVFLFLLEI